MDNKEQLKEYTDWFLNKYIKTSNHLMKCQSFMMNMPWYVKILYGRRIYKFIRSQFDE